MRVFIGFELPNEVKEYLYDLQYQLFSHAIGGHKTSYQNFHLTLVFIGDVAPDQINDLCDIIEKSISSIHPFEIKIGDVGYFNQRNSFVLWSKVIDGLSFLNQLYQSLEKALIEHGFLSMKKRYKPHITLARQVKMLPDLSKPILNGYHQHISFSEITLFQSHRINEVLTYTPIEHFALEK